jgi:hypothetical protein
VEPPQSSAPQPLPRVVLVSRVAHGLISAVFLSCIAIVYLAAWRGRVDALAFAALAALSLEGALVLLSRGNCPLGPLFRHFGDDKPFFELMLGARAGKLAFPALTGVTVLGTLVLGARTLL